MLKSKIYNQINIDINAIHPSCEIDIFNGVRNAITKCDNVLQKEFYVQDNKYIMHFKIGDEKKDNDFNNIINIDILIKDKLNDNNNYFNAIVSISDKYNIISGNLGIDKETKKITISEYKNFKDIVDNFINENSDKFKELSIEEKNNYFKDIYNKFNDISFDISAGVNDKKFNEVYDERLHQILDISINDLEKYKAEDLSDNFSDDCE